MLGASEQGRGGAAGVCLRSCSHVWGLADMWWGAVLSSVAILGSQPVGKVRGGGLLVAGNCPCPGAVVVFNARAMPQQFERWCCNRLWTLCIVARVASLFPCVCGCGAGFMEQVGEEDVSAGRGQIVVALQPAWPKLDV